MMDMIEHFHGHGVPQASRRSPKSKHAHDNHSQPVLSEAAYRDEEPESPAAFLSNPVLWKHRHGHAPKTDPDK
ncbi:MAG: hypothetical protein AB7P20_28770, partial [Rhizobiaceae bacterium]